MSRQLRDFPRPKVDLVLRYAREEAVRQEARLEAFRGRAGGLLAFAAVLAALSVAAAADRGGGVLIFMGIVCIVIAAACFLGGSAGFRLMRNPEPRALARDYLYLDVEDIQMQILSNTLDDIVANERIVLQVESLYTLGLVLLAAGTIVIGARVAWLVL